ncbi:GNAT family N-acetyltransferase [Metabacillus fastidiosus]|uniref:GNAT family N-acetyltransferase n=1 Tax=Metabacillus fastidiosus TaxID=1458 RepID=UPI002E245766|nr:GNAT family N-acetyltransferase [Metabacillus fastidiosus]
MQKFIEMCVFENQDIETIETWFEDFEIRRRLEGILPLRKWYEYVKENTEYFVWIALENKQSVGIVMVELEENHTGSIALAVNPFLRNKGYGKVLIERTMALPVLNSVEKWFAGIEEDNIACLKCFQSIGYSFENIQPDEDGYYSLIYLVER